ncbi:hypothetical protein N657DRAFT_1004 [Parathielavia appendiculata]|uniref:Uncharacterized protein n=1 Tax=Parathielavia appendiculata TaxID=2587402 RepID=A0AAN6U7U4_9PEZI|nr:hypothetical protein N657DRAFT_1004 [Parathielavia appendiculata]
MGMEAAKYFSEIFMCNLHLPPSISGMVIPWSGSSCFTSSSHLESEMDKTLGPWLKFMSTKPAWTRNAVIVESLGQQLLRRQVQTSSRTTMEDDEPETATAQGIRLINAKHCPNYRLQHVPRQHRCWPISGNTQR